MVRGLSDLTASPKTLWSPLLLPALITGMLVNRFQQAYHIKMKEAARHWAKKKGNKEVVKFR